jgi:PST family polysaccharide transporter
MKPDGELLKHQTIRGLVWMGSGKAACVLLQLLVLSLLGRLITPAQFGLASAALIVTGLSSTVSSFGLGPALIQRPALERRHIDTAFTASLVFGFGLGAIIWLSAPLLADVMHMHDLTPVLRALAWLFPLQAFGTIASSLLTRDLEFSWLAARNVLTFGLGYGAVGIGTALLGWGVWALVAAELAQAGVESALLLTKRRPSRWLTFDRAAFNDLARYGGGFALARLANYAALYGDNLVTGRFLGAAALGYYGRAYQLMSAPHYAFGAVLDAVLFPTMAKVQSDTQRLARAYLRGVGLIALVVLPLSATVILVAPELIRVALGPNWDAAVAPFQVLGIGMLFRTSYKISDSIARSTGAVYRRAWLQFLYASFVVIGAWIGQHWGIVGVAWGSLAALTLNFILMASLSLGIAQVTWIEFWNVHRPAAMLTLVSLPLVWMAVAGARTMSFPAVVNLLIAGVTLVAVCGGVVVSAPSVFLGAEGIWMLGTARSSFGKLFSRPSAGSIGAMPADGVLPASDGGDPR